MSFEVKNNVKISELNNKDKEIYDTLEEHFNKYYYDFNYPKTLEGNIWNYYCILSRYLRDKGYGYASKLVGKFIRTKTVNELELAKVLMDCNLIKKYSKSFITNIENKSKFEYDIEDGLKINFYMKYEEDATLEIEEPLYNNEDYIYHSFEDDEYKKINFYINIKPNENINFTEIISVKTSYGVDILEFTVQCNHTKSKKILLDDIKEFYSLCESDRIKALMIFKNNDFKEWLKEKKYAMELINYNKALLIGNGNSSIALKYFCMLNNIYINDIYTDYEAVYNNSTNDSIHKTVKKEEKAKRLESEDLLKDKNKNKNDAKVHKNEITFIQKLKKLFGRK